MITFSGRVFLVVDYFPFHHIEYITSVPAIKSANTPMEFPCYINVCFSLVVFKVLLVFNFCHLIRSLGMDLLCLSFFDGLHVLFFAIIYSNKLSAPFCLLLLGSL